MEKKRNNCVKRTLTNLWRHFIYTRLFFIKKKNQFKFFYFIIIIIIFIFYFFSNLNQGELNDNTYNINIDELALDINNDNSINRRTSEIEIQTAIQQLKQ